MVQTKRGQAAMEFLMTYGWAILVVLIAIGALAYFGVLNPNSFLPDRCNMPSGFNCKDFKVVNLAGAGADYMTISVENGAGRDVTIRSFVVNSTDIATATSNGVGACFMASSALLLPVVIPSGRIVNITAGGAGGTVCDMVASAPVKAKYNFVMAYSWSDVPNSVHTMEGDMFTRTETS